MSTALRTATFATLIAAAACVGLAPAVLAQVPDQPSPTIGRWKLNVEKSQNRASTASRNVIWTFEDRGGGLIFATVFGYNPDGNSTFTQYAVKHDGKYYPYQSRGAQIAASIAYMPTDNPRHYEWFIKADGIPANHGTTTVSDDGMTLTFSNFTTREGQPITIVSVFDRLP